MMSRAWRSSASPAGVGRTPRGLRETSATSQSASRSASRLLTAEGAMNSRSAARAIVPSSHTAMKRRNDV